MTNEALRGKSDAGNQKTAVLVPLVALASLAEAAIWVPTTGGHLDASENWTDMTSSTFAIRKAQSAPFTISKDGASLPGSGSLRYDFVACWHTNDFGSGMTFALPNRSLAVADGAKVRQVSGVISTFADTSITAGASESSGIDVSGPGSGFVTKGLSLSAPASAGEGVSPFLTISDGANFTSRGTVNNLIGSVYLGGNAKLTVDGANFDCPGSVHVGIEGADNVFAVSNGSHVVCGSVYVYSNNLFSVEGSMVVLSNFVAVSTHGKAVFKKSAVDTLVTNANHQLTFGGDDGTLLLEDSSVAIGYRSHMQGTNFTFKVVNTTIEHTPDAWFLTGANANETVELSRRLVFGGTNSLLRITGSKGLYLRGGVLAFEIPDGGFPLDRAVVELTNPSARFSGEDLASHVIEVSVSDRCPNGDYTLLKGTFTSEFKAKFLEREGALVANGDRHSFIVATEGGWDVLKIRVRNRVGMVLVFR